MYVPLLSDLGIKMDFSILKTLTSLPGISGRESAVRRYVEQQAAPYADEIKTDALGNLIVFKKGSSSKNLLLAAHMDEVGLMIHYVGADGFLRFVTVGGIDPRTLLAQRVTVHTSGGPLVGVIGTRPAHVTTEADRGKAVPLKDLFIDVGLSGAEAQTRVQAGDFATLRREYEEFGDGFITAKSLDNRSGVFVLLELLKALKNPFYNVYAVFTVQEEVGLRGAITAAYGVEADLALALDTTGAADIPGTAPQDYITVLGRGVGVTALDARTITHEGLFAALKRLCLEKQIRYQVRIAPRGGNDAGAIHLSKTGTACCALSIPTRYIHSNTEVQCKADLENTLALALAVAQTELAL